jgi:predicted component of type VI protein secretion system
MPGGRGRPWHNWENVMIVRLVVIAPTTHASARDVELPVLIGRADEAKFRIRDDRISRRHCELTFEDDVVRIRDLGSTNGTFLDDEQIERNAPVEVPPNAIVRVGSCKFRVEYESPAEKTAVGQGGLAEANDATVHESPVQEAPVPDTAPAEAGGVNEAAGDVAAAPAALPPSESTVFSFGVGSGKEPTVATKADAWLPPVVDEEPPSAPDDEALGNFFKGLK